MSKIAIVILADIEGREALGRIVNALTAAKEFKEGGDNVQVLFTGAGTKWISELVKPEHLMHSVYVGLKDCVTGACGFCAGAFNAADAAKANGVCLIEDFGKNMSYRKLITDGYQVLTF